MADRLDDLPEGGSSSNDPMMDAYFEKPAKPKKTWKEYGKAIAIALVAFTLAANPFTGLFISNIGMFQGAYKAFFAQMALFLVLYAVMSWYF